MATWDKDVIFIQLATTATGADDTGSYTVKFQPIDQAYPTGAVAGVQCSSDKSKWQPASDLDTMNHYDIYVDDTRIGRIFGMDAVPSFGG